MIDEYLKAKKTGEKVCRERAAKGENPYVQALDYILPGNDGMSHQALGLVEIPVDLIVGTKTQARQNSFSPDFMPLLEADTEFAMKWSSLYKAQMDEGFNSPIKVYEYLHKFYVQEGNKRVSVSRFLGMPTIMADVIRIIPKPETLEDHPAYAEFLDFYKVAPIYDIVCDRKGSYTEIASLLGRPLDGSKDKWPDEMIRSLMSLYWRFCETFRALSDRMPEMASGDAFALYLRIYVKDGLKQQSPKEMEKRILRIRKELLTEDNIDNVSLVESSDKALKAGSVLTKVLPVHSYSAKHPLKAAFIYDRMPEDSDWLYNHESGRLRLEKAYDGIVATKRLVTSGSDGEDCFAFFEEAVDAAAEWGADVIFTTSVTQMDDALRAAIRYSDIRFLNCSINLAHHAVRTYYAKQYEAKFLAGVIAGTYAAADGSHMIGYCSDYPIYGTIAAINAFAIGAAMVDPKVKIYLDWSGRRDSNWWWSMVDKGIHVISAVDSTHNKDGSNAYGLCYVEKVSPGEGTDLSGTCRITNLAAPIWKWGKLYEIIIRTILDGTYNAKLVDRKDRATNYWWGMISGVVDIEMSDTVPAGTRRLVQLLRADIIDGRFNPFDGELRSQSGLVNRQDDAPLTSMEVIKMDWLAANIIGSIPEAKDLSEGGRQTVSVSGVKK